MVFMSKLLYSQCHSFGDSSDKVLSGEPTANRFGITLPCVGSGVERIGPLRFLAGCRKSQLNQAVSVLSVSLGSFLSESIVQLTRATSCVVLSCAICVFCLLVDLVCLSEPVQVIDWIDLSPK